jgi:hypothetical protein
LPCKSAAQTGKRPTGVGSRKLKKENEINWLFVKNEIKPVIDNKFDFPCTDGKYPNLKITIFLVFFFLSRTYAIGLLTGLSYTIISSSGRENEASGLLPLA